MRKALAWTACNKLKKIWSSQISRNLKKRLFFATVESVFLYGSETWSINKSLKKKIDGCYTRLLRMALNISWRQRLTNAELYQEIPPVTKKIQRRRMMLSGHCVRHNDECASDLVLWEPIEGTPNRGRKRISYVDNLIEDTGVNNVNELKTLMLGRNLLKARVGNIGRPGDRHR